MPSIVICWPEAIKREKAGQKVKSISEAKDFGEYLKKSLAFINLEFVIQKDIGKTNTNLNPNPNPNPKPEPNLNPKP